MVRRTLTRLSTCKVSMLQVFFGKFYRQIKKYTIMTSFHVAGNWKISNFVKLNTGHHHAKFQFFWLSGSNFMEVSVRPQKHHYDIIMTSFLINKFPN